MQEQYSPQSVEASAQHYWEQKQSFQAQEDPSREKFYCLAMFPYPSGNLHVGHARNYSISDVIARYQRMLGKNVLHPIGWDAFGLPAENAAIEHKTAPAKWTYENIARMREQLKSLGFSYDWSRELTTCHPEYYRWEQWLFLKMLEKGLAYKKMATVNWDPVDQTVLANEQVVDGKGWRSGSTIERREISQWFLKITDYAEELLNELDELDQWPEQVRLMQKNWIGRSEGLDITFKVDQHDTTLTVYTTRPDTLMGISYLCVAPEHDLAALAANSDAEIANFIQQCKNTKVAEADMANQEKLGIATPFHAIHPITEELVPIWIANYVINTYGSGAVMAVPAHDQRDFEFATKYHLDKPIVILDQDNQLPDITNQSYDTKGTLVNSGKFDGLSFSEAFSAIENALNATGCANKSIKYRLHDWGISRQRYWGAPIPIINCDSCGAQPVPEEDLPVVLPEKIAFTDGAISLKDIPEFYKTICPKCSSPATRETDTFDTFMESSWYYARYSCPRQDKSMLDSRAKYWAPVDQYVGGVEHAVMHLLYARFMHKVLRDEGLVNTNEPFSRLLTQGMVLKDGSKMSKSKGNTIDPGKLVSEYGADSMRLFVIFTAPPEQSLEWSDSGFDGAFRFLKRLWTFVYERQQLLLENNAIQVEWDRVDNEQRDIWREIHSILQQVTQDYERLQLNTVVSGCMKLFNILNKIPLNFNEQAQPHQNKVNNHLIYTGTKILLCILSPVAPHICHELWRAVEFGGAVINAPWPKPNSQALTSKSINLIIQVNGKLRSKISVPSDSEKSFIEAAALEDESVQRHIGDNAVKKIIIVPNRLVNIVV